MKELTETERMVIGTAMNNMMKDGHVNICAIDKCLQIAGVLPSHADYKLLSTLHCIKLADMPPELAKRVPQMIGNCFNGLDVADLMAAVVPPGRSGTALQLIKRVPA